MEGGNAQSVVMGDSVIVCGGVEKESEVYSAPLQSIVESTQDTPSKVWIMKIMHVMVYTNFEGGAACHSAVPQQRCHVDSEQC